MARIYAISIKQPWAALVVSGRKSIEVRSWATRIRGRVLIHAARVPDPRPEAWRWVTVREQSMTDLGGGIIGAATLSDCLAYGDPDSFKKDGDRHLNAPEWFQSRGLFGFVFERPEALPFVRVAGNVRFFTVEEPA
jgi:hypothetical protein